MASRYTIDEQFFDDLNEYSAYILGYLYALGSIYRGKDGTRNELVISGTDPVLLEDIRRHMGATYRIITKGGGFQLRINNKAIVDKLGELGLTANKTRRLTYPRWLTEEMEPHFIRGYFDGKGSFMTESGRRVTTNISGGNIDFIEGLRDRLVLYGLTRAEIHQYGADHATNVIRYYVNDTRKLYTLLYNEARIYSSINTAKYNQGV
jgi:hypothetical protein